MGFSLSERKETIAEEHVWALELGTPDSDLILLLRSLVQAEELIALNFPSFLWQELFSWAVGMNGTKHGGQREHDCVFSMLFPTLSIGSIKLGNE